MRVSHRKGIGTKEAKGFRLAITTTPQVFATSGFAAAKYRVRPQPGKGNDSPRQRRFACENGVAYQHHESSFSHAGISPRASSSLLAASARGSCTKPYTKQAGVTVYFHIAKERNGKFPRKLRSGQHEFSKTCDPRISGEKSAPRPRSKSGITPWITPGITIRHCTRGYTLGHGRFCRGYTQDCRRFGELAAGNAGGDSFRAKSNAARERENLRAEKHLYHRPRNCSLRMNSFCGRCAPPSFPSRRESSQWSAITPGETTAGWHGHIAQHR